MPGIQEPEIGVSIARSEAERERCFALRYRVYVEEQGRRPPTADHERGLDRNADDAESILFQAIVDGEVVGTARVHHGAETGIPAFVADACDLPHLLGEAPETEMAAFSRLAVDAGHRGGKTTLALLRACFAYLTAGERRTRLVLILALDEPRLIDMYRLLGFRPIAPDRWYTTDLGRALPMVATIGAAFPRPSL